MTVAAPKRSGSGSVVVPGFLSFFFQGLLDAQPGMGKAKLRRLLFLFHEIHEIASPTVIELLCIGSLNLAATERTRDDPASPPSHITIVGAINRAMHGYGANP